MKVGIPAWPVIDLRVVPHPGRSSRSTSSKADLSTVLLSAWSSPSSCRSAAGRYVDQWVRCASGHPVKLGCGPTQTQTQTHSRPQTSASEAPRLTKRPGFVPAVLSITLPVILCSCAIGELTLDGENGVRKFLEFLGTPAVALLLEVLVSMFFLGLHGDEQESGVEKSVGSALPGIAGILLHRVPVALQTNARRRRRRCGHR